MKLLIVYFSPFPVICFLLLHKLKMCIIFAFKMTVLYTLRVVNQSDVSCPSVRSAAAHLILP